MKGREITIRFTTEGLDVATAEKTATEMLLLQQLRDEQFIVAENMERYGGSFVEYLGFALYRADVHNAAKIKKTWPELWEKYLNWGKKKCDVNTVEKQPDAD